MRKPKTKKPNLDEHRRTVTATKPWIEPPQVQPLDTFTNRQAYACHAMNALIMRDSQFKSLDAASTQLDIETQIARAAWTIADAMSAQETWPTPTGSK